MITATTEQNDPGTGNTVLLNPNLPVTLTGNIDIYGDAHTERPPRLDPR